MLALESIREAFSLFIKNKFLWKFAFVTIGGYFALSRMILWFSRKMEFYGGFNWASFALVLLFFSIIEVGLIYAVDLLSDEKEIFFDDLLSALKASSKHLVTLYVFLIIILAVLFVFLLPVLNAITVVFVDETPENLLIRFGDQMIWFSTLLLGVFYFVSPMVSRYFVLRGGTYWRSIVEGSRILLTRLSDSFVLLVFFILTVFLRFVFLGILFSGNFFTPSSQNITKSILSIGISMAGTSLGNFLSLPIFTFFVLWWSVATTLYFKKVEHMLTYKPKWKK